MAGVEDADLPAPIATNLKTGYYVDNFVSNGATYFYKIRTWKAGVSILGGEIRVVANEVIPPFSDAITDVIGDALGYYFNPNYLDSMWQDAAMTIPAVVGSPVRVVRNLCPKGTNPLYAVAPSDSARPILRKDSSDRHYLEFNGAQGFRIPSVVLGTRKLTTFYKVQTSMTSNWCMIMEISPNFNSYSNSIYRTFDYSSAYGNTGMKLGSVYRFDVGGVAQQIAWAMANTNTNYTVVTQDNGDTNMGYIRTNKVDGNPTNYPRGNGNFGTYDHYIGYRGEGVGYLTGRIYEFGCFNRLCSPSEITTIENFISP